MRASCSTTRASSGPRSGVDARAARARRACRSCPCRGRAGTRGRARSSTSGASSQSPTAIALGRGRRDLRARTSRDPEQSHDGEHPSGRPAPRHARDANTGRVRPWPAASPCRQPRERRYSRAAREEGIALVQARVARHRLEERVEDLADDRPGRSPSSRIRSCPLTFRSRVDSAAPCGEDARDVRLERARAPRGPARSRAPWRARRPR